MPNLCDVECCDLSLVWESPLASPSSRISPSQFCFLGLHLIQRQSPRSLSKKSVIISFLSCRFYRCDVQRQPELELCELLVSLTSVVPHRYPLLGHCQQFRRFSYLLSFSLCQIQWVVSLVDLLMN
jgi:hypothetical protein